MPNFTSPDGSESCILALNGSNVTMHELSSVCCDPSIKNKSGKTPVDYVADMEIAQMLTKRM